MTKIFQLKCDDFQSHLAKKFSELRRNTNFNDVTLVCDDGQKLFANKLVLATSSEYFFDILNTCEDVSSTFCFDGTNCAEFNLILDYVYFGQIKINLTDIDRFLSLANKFKLYGFYNVENQERGKKEKIGVPSEKNKPKKRNHDTKTEFTEEINKKVIHDTDQENINNIVDFSNITHQDQNDLEKLSEQPNIPVEDIANILKEGNDISETLIEKENLRSASVSSRITVMNDELISELQEIQFTRKDETEPNIYHCNNCEKCFDAFFLAHRHYQCEHQNLDMEREILMGLFEFKKKMKKYLKSLGKEKLDNEFQTISTEFQNKVSKLNEINERILNPSLKEKYHEIKQYLEMRVHFPNSY